MCVVSLHVPVNAQNYLYVCLNYIFGRIYWEQACSNIVANLASTPNTVALPEIVKFMQRWHQHRHTELCHIEYSFLQCKHFIQILKIFNFQPVIISINMIIFSMRHNSEGSSFWCTDIAPLHFGVCVDVDTRFSN